MTIQTKASNILTSSGQSSDKLPDNDEYEVDRPSSFVHNFSVILITMFHLRNFFPASIQIS